MDVNLNVRECIPCLSDWDGNSATATLLASPNPNITWRLLTPYARHPCVSRLYLDTDMPSRAQFVLLQASTVPVERIHRAFRTGMGDRWIIRERFELMLPFLLRATVPDKGSRIGPGMSGLSSLVSH